MKYLLLTLFVTQAHAVEFAPDPYGRWTDYNTYMNYQSEQIDDYLERSQQRLEDEWRKQEMERLERRVWELEND